jgi:hypothetical protein
MIMKKQKNGMAWILGLLLACVVLALAYSPPALAGSYYQQSFINPSVRSFLVMSNANAGWNGGWTNLNTALVTTFQHTNGYTTNWAQAGQFLTNSVGRLGAIGTNYGRGFDSLNVLSDVPLKSSVDTLGFVGAASSGFATNVYDGVITIRLVGVAAAATSTNFFRFVPIPNGADETTETAKWITCQVVANGTTPVVASFPIPKWNVYGAESLRCYAVWNGDADWGGSTWVTAIDYHGFGP